MKNQNQQRYQQFIFGSCLGFQQSDVFLANQQQGLHMERTHQEKPLIERLRSRVAARSETRRRSSLRKIIEVRAIFADAKLRELSSEDLAMILQQEGIHISAGTLRNYKSKIDLAIATLAASGSELPSDQEIHRAINKSDARLKEQRCLENRDRSSSHAGKAGRK